MGSMFDQIGGEPAVRALVERFYGFVETLPEGARILHLHLNGHGMAHVRAEQFDFLCGFMGGPGHYRERHGHMDLRHIHAHVEITKDDAENWLFCMNRALDEVKLPEPFRHQLFSTLTRAAHMLVNSPASDRPDPRQT